MMARAPSGGRPLAACTIVCRNYLSHARVLAKSFAEHEPGGRFYLLVADGLPDGAEAGCPATLLGPADLGLPNFDEMCFEYTVTELCTAVKPALLLLLSQRFGEAEVAYLDPDILVCRPLAELREPLASGSIVLTPAITRPLPRDGKRPCDGDILIAGAHNLGFIALRRTAEALEFLHWWDDRLRNGGALVDVPRGLMTDQKWLDLAPSLFPGTRLLRDETYNVAWWNTHSRTIDRRDGEFLVNGRPLTFFHFSGFDPADPGVFTKECENRTAVIPGSPLAELLAHYARLHLENGHAATSRWRCRFAWVDNGVSVNLPLRRLYLELDDEERAPFGDPFRAGPGSFLDWATTPDPAEGGLSPFLLSLYQLRRDLQAVLPDVRGHDREDFLRWAREHGAREHRYDPDAMRVPEPAPAPPRAGVNGSPRATADAALPPEHVRQYARLRRKVRRAVCEAVPPGAGVAVVSKGDDELLQLDGRSACHFPPAPDGTYAGYNPADSDEAIALLGAVRAGGARFLVVPAPALWWLDHYDGFKRHLEEHCPTVPVRDDSCRVYDLSLAAGTVVTSPVAATAPARRAPRCSVVIPVYGKASLTRQCLDTLLGGSERAPFEIVVVDDCSTDGTREVLAGYGDHVRVVAHATNTGFATSCNDGVAAASGEYLVFLNNDTVPRPGWLDALVGYAERHPRAGAIGGKLLFPDDTIQHAGVVFVARKQPMHVYAGFPADHPAVNKSRRFQAVTGACLLIRRARFAELGGFDTAYLNGFEDIDLCLRLGERGYEVHYCHESVVYHLESVSREAGGEDARRNAVFFHRRWDDRLEEDEVRYYVEDGLLTLEHTDLCPLLLSVSPMLAAVKADGRVGQADRILNLRARQVEALLKENIRLSVRLKEAELRAEAAAGRAPRVS
jgi:GT2 family glycosyltransferase